MRFLSANGVSWLRCEGSIASANEELKLRKLAVTATYAKGVMLGPTLSVNRPSSGKRKQTR